MGSLDRIAASGEPIDFFEIESDEKPEKQIARKMIAMSIEINKNYFEVDHPVLGSGVLSVTCITCHQGAAHPPQ